MRIVLGIEYVGTRYHGWQVQNSELPTVQYHLEKAVSQVANHPVVLTCAGRTDTGVHAIGQFAHFDTHAMRPLSAWTFGVNTYLPKDIRVVFAKEVDEAFHARFSATARRYRYYIYNNPHPSAVYHQRMTWIYRNLKSELMHDAAQSLLGEHDFSSFRGMDCQAKTPIRTITHFTVKHYGKIIVLDVKANAFLHHMVRNMVGVLLEIGQGKKEATWAQEVLIAKDRTMAGVTAPAEGLYLVEVDYPAHFEIVKPLIDPILVAN